MMIVPVRDSVTLWRFTLFARVRSEIKQHAAHNGAVRYKSWITGLGLLYVGVLIEELLVKQIFYLQAQDTAASRQTISDGGIHHHKVVGVFAKRRRRRQFNVLIHIGGADLGKQTGGRAFSSEVAHENRHARGVHFANGVSSRYKHDGIPRRSPRRSPFL